MILRSDFRITVEQLDTKVRVRVVHTPTGNEQTTSPKDGESVNKVIDHLITQLTAKVFNPLDFMVQRGRREGGRDFVTVVHVPTGKHRSEFPIYRGKKPDVVTRLMDDLVTELMADQGCMSDSNREKE